VPGTLLSTLHTSFQPMLSGSIHLMSSQFFISLSWLVPHN
jgi:hypothetical protein